MRVEHGRSDVLLGRVSHRYRNGGQRLTASDAVDCWTGVSGPAHPVSSPVVFTQIGVGSPGAGYEHFYHPMFSCGISTTGDTYCWAEDFIASKLGGS